MGTENKMLRVKGNRKRGRSKRRKRGNEKKSIRSNHDERKK